MDNVQRKREGYSAQKLGQPALMAVRDHSLAHMRATVPGRPSSPTGQSLALTYPPPPFDHALHATGRTAAGTFLRQRPERERGGFVTAREMNSSCGF
uniref:Uncharacterized protein n=1 Tax=Hordeum vulgare subsp. vulgare TaxID=112509 RepID=A0A8I6XHK0_HORVV